MQTPGLLVFGAGVSKDTVQRTVGYAKTAEARGFHSCLVTEAASDALSLAQHIASVTSRIQVGTAITNIFLRPPLLAAMQALTINAVAPGRLFLGLGTSHGPLNQAYGLPMDKPLTALRMYVHTLDRVFRGEHEGLAQMARMGMAVAKPETKIPIALAGVSPKSLQLTGEVADASIPTPYGAGMLKEVVDAIAVGAKKAGRSPQEVAINPIVHTLVCADRDAALRSAKQHLAFYASMPFYNRVFDLPMRDIATPLALVTGIGGLGAYLGGVLADRLARVDARWYMWLPGFAALLAVPLMMLQYFTASYHVSIVTGVLTAMLLNSFLAPLVATAQSLVSATLRAFTSAVLVLCVNLLGLGLGPLVTGMLSDLLISRFGLEHTSLHYAIAASALAALWGAAHFMRAAVYLRDELPKATTH